MPYSVREHVAGVLRAEMARQRLSTRDVAAKVGRSHPWVANRANGQTPCDVDDLEVLAGALGMSPADFFTHPGPTHPTPTGPSQPPTPRTGRAA